MERQPGELIKKEAQGRTSSLDYSDGVIICVLLTQYCDTYSNNAILSSFLNESISCSVHRVFKSGTKCRSVVPRLKMASSNALSLLKTRRHSVCCPRGKEWRSMPKRKKKLHWTLLENHRTQIQHVNVFLNQVTKTSRGLCVSAPG